MNNCLLKSFKRSSLGLGGCLGAFVQLYKQLMLVLTLVKDVVGVYFTRRSAWPGQWLSLQMTDTLPAGLFRDAIASRLRLN